jgi:hypothetical protein
MRCAKKYQILVVLAISFLMMQMAIPAANADTVTQVATIEAFAVSIFSVEFYTEPGKVLYSTMLPFTNINPEQGWCYPDGRQPYDGKSDVGLIFRTNLGVPWYFKLHAQPASTPSFPMAYFKFFISQPYNRNTNPAVPTDGQLHNITPGEWNTIPLAATMIYSSGSDKNNTPFGTLATLSFAIDAQRIPNRSYTLTITYTLSTTP